MYMMTAELETYLVRQWILGGLIAWVVWFVWAVVMIGIATKWNPLTVQKWSEKQDSVKKAPIWLTAAKLVIWPWGTIDRGLLIVNECRHIVEEESNRYQKK